ncbi:unnamed protein product [Onchocerca flexuosa]|uniref:RING-type domain-containing protein n=1 Tax=Onchocerca flexuosa TaxID=387005 RepID=A0A183H9H2_9BILA|nr:unnamed protein product [Onchocerca flexuosa]
MFKRHNMFIVSDCRPAMELYGSLEMKQFDNNHLNTENLETSSTPEERLQLLGIKNSIIQEKLGVKTSCEANNPNKQIILMMDPFEPMNFKKKLQEDEVKVSKHSTRSWLWHQYLSRHGNCSLCERPLNGLHEDVVMLTCAHALHQECAQEMHQNRNGCRRCESDNGELHHSKWNGKNGRKNCLCC